MKWTVEIEKSPSFEIQTELKTDSILNNVLPVEVYTFGERGIKGDKGDKGDGIDELDFDFANYFNLQMNIIN